VNVLNFTLNAKTDANVQKRLAFHSSEIEGNRERPRFIAPKEGRNRVQVYAYNGSHETSDIFFANASELVETGARCGVG
jgi:hypothetical protein